ncbi:phage tail protein [Ralstonia solanacearum]|nr:phage tail protein [Ralstonia solanacearum FJAT-1458]QKL72128.1 phage tail protein [Ralstonia solanacearum]QKL77333.1 phage tail protein [Ralstonia solanacearum]QKL82539.1 phage tail protein [Ralstonia solanacearum]QKL87749.1 phage tail protein [Ralstonia solanacearum]
MSNTTSTALSAQGTKIEISSGGTTPTYTQVTNVSDISGFDGKATAIDTTTLSSTAKEKTLGLQDWGSVTLATDINLKEPSHMALLTAKKSGALTGFRVTLSDGSTLVFMAFVMQFPISAKVDSVYKGNIVLEITGDITVTPAA